MEVDEKKHWTHFDLLEQVKKICNENNLKIWTNGHNIVAEKLLQLIGEKDLSASEITNFRLRYFRVIKKFNEYHGNFAPPKIQEYGNKVFVVLKDK